MFYIQITDNQCIIVFARWKTKLRFPDRPTKYLCNMLILLDCRPLQYAGPDNEKSRQILSCAALLTAEQGVEWLCLVDHTYRPWLLPALPAHTLLTRRAFPGWAGWKIWYDGQIPRWAKKYRADLVMTTAGISAGSMHIPQCVWMPERADPLEGKGPGKESSLLSAYSARLAESLFRAATIFCYSDKDKSFLTGRTSGRVEDKIIVVPPAPDATSGTLSAEEKEKVKAACSTGKEYFLASVAGLLPREIVSLLKAFSLFKKRQLSNMQLILMDGPAGIGRPAAGNLAKTIKPAKTDKPDKATRDLTGRLETYKYRQDVHWFDDPSAEDRARITGAAYAVLFPLAGDILGTSLLNTWQAEVPVIATDIGRLPGIAGEAALYGGPDNPITLATQLMLIYKDEALRQDLIKKGNDRLRFFSGQRPVDAVWQGIRMAKII